MLKDLSAHNIYLLIMVVTFILPPINPTPRP